MDFAELDPALSATAPLIADLEYHAWGPEDFLFGHDQLFQLSEGDPARKAIEAVVQALVACDRSALDGFVLVRKELSGLPVPEQELDFVEFHLRRRVLGWQDYMTTVARASIGAGPSLPWTTDTSAAVAASAFSTNASVARSTGRLIEFLLIYSEGLFRQFLSNLLILPYATGLAPSLGEFVTRTAFETPHLSRWATAVKGQENLTPEKSATAYQPPSLGDHWLEALLNIGLSFNAVPNPVKDSDASRNQLRAHLRKLADTLPQACFVHVPPDYPEARFLSWFVPFFSETDCVRYPLNPISKGFFGLASSADEEL